MTFNPNPTPTISNNTAVSLGIRPAAIPAKYDPPEALYIYDIYGVGTVAGAVEGTISQPPPGTTSEIVLTSYIWNSTSWSYRVTQSNGAGYSSNRAIAQTNTIDGSVPPQPSPTLLPVVGQGNIVEWVLNNRFPSYQVPLTIESFKTISTSNTYSLTNLSKPQIADYFNGYFLDTASYKVDIDLSITVSVSGNVLLHYYYKENEIQVDSDGVSHQTISIQTLDLEVKSNRPFRIKFTAVPCSISLEGSTTICNQIRAKIESTYPKAFPNYLPIQQAYWNSLYQQQLSTLQSQPNYYQSIELDNKPYLWAATERWEQDTVADRNTGTGIGEDIKDSFVFNKYFRLNLDGTYGDDMADSAMLKLISNTVNAPKWGVNPDNPDVLRVDNLGWRINRICDVWGIRVKPDGTIDTDKEKKLTRQVIDKTKNIDDKKIGVNGFGELGMLVRRITNRFKKKGKNAEIVSDQCVIVQDIPQLMQEYFEQINLALGIQESSAIELRQGEKGQDVARFNNQLEMLIELINLMSSGNEMVRAALVSSLVTQSQTNELIAGLGLPSVTKTIPVKIDNKVSQIPFKGIAAHRSISQEIATCTYNVGIATGQLL